MKKELILKSEPIVKPVDYLNNNTNVFFTSDFHVGHSNVIKFDNRPFKNVNEMAETLIENWNNVVSDDSIVYYLGDLSFKVKSDYTKWFVHQLKGDIRVILGNHDRMKDLLKLDRFSDIQTAKKVVIIDDDGERVHIELSHYPHLTWDRSHHGSIHLHGHCHQNLTTSEYGEVYYKRKVIDVGCMGHNYTPLSFRNVMDIMSMKNIEEV